MAQQYTRRLIRDTFVEMLNEMPLDKITVKEIVERCGLNRNTFYYHYADIYAVLEEIFDMSLAKAIDEYSDTTTWEEAFVRAASFALDNKRAVYHIYNSMRREDLEKFLYGVAGNIMRRYVDKIAANLNVNMTDKELIAQFYQSALTQYVLQWISTGMNWDVQAMIYRLGKLLDGNIEASLKRVADDVYNT